MKKNQISEAAHTRKFAMSPSLGSTPLNDRQRWQSRIKSHPPTLSPSHPLLQAVLALFLAFPAWAQQEKLAIKPVNFAAVRFDDAFWKPRMDKVAAVTVPVCITYTEEKTGRIRNFDRAAGQLDGPHEGIFYDDSDVYKALEAMAYTLKVQPNPAIEQKADEWIDKIAAAQQPDGYLNTYYTVTGLDKRWTDMSMHEMYCAGHLIEAAVAYYDATGKRKLLDVAIRYADHLDATFGPGKKGWVPGHQEIELALVKLYHTTADQHYLRLANWLLEQRGKGLGKGYTWDNKTWGGVNYCQDNVPVKDITDITGHAVRAMYMYTGMADVAAEIPGAGYEAALQRVWEDVVGRNMYVTGGIGSSGQNEGFTTDYDLPTESAYCETCASVGMVFWNQRLFLMTGESRYFDVLERSLYNGALDGLSLSGDRFFYGNPLESDGRHARREWFGTACCPSNIARLIASLGNYCYAHNDRAVWVNLYAGNSANVQLAQGKVGIVQQTNYPWDGAVSLTVKPEKKMAFALHLRLPGWTGNEASPGGLYRFMDVMSSPVQLLVNGKPVEWRQEKGYAVIQRNWRSGDVVSLSLPMSVRRVVAADNLAACANRTALQRGPLVYCFEGPDNDGDAFNIIVPDHIPFSNAWREDLLGGVMTLIGDASVILPSPDGQSVATWRRQVTAIPYYAWNNRGPARMQVWMPRAAVRARVWGD